MKYIVSADWHLRFDNPECRTDDFLAMQKKTVEYIANKTIEYNADLIIAGDILHRNRPRSANYIYNLLLKSVLCKIQNRVYFIAGNHDLPAHNYDRDSHCAYNVIEDIFNNVQKDLKLNNDIHCFNFGTEIEDHIGLCIMHRFCVVKDLPPYIEDGITADTLLSDYDYQYIITGDNHSGFVHREKNRYVINPGCITRQSAKMQKYEPFVVLLDTETQEIKKILLPDNDAGVITREHLDVKNDRDSRIDSFVEKLQSVESIDLSFEKQLENYCNKNNIENDIKDKIYKSLED